MWNGSALTPGRRLAGSGESRWRLALGDPLPSRGMRTSCRRSGSWHPAALMPASMRHAVTPPRMLLVVPVGVVVA